MLLMLRLLAITLLLSSISFADSNSEKIEEFLSDKFDENPALQSVSVDVEEVVPLKQLKGWDAYIVSVKASLKNKPKSVINQKMVWFSNGSVITKELTNMKNGKSFTDLVKPNFKDKYYTRANLIYGNANARHKVAIFSDPLCPFCRGFVPGAIKDMKKNPQKFAIYYYHLPLERIHPASVTLVKAAAAAELQGVKDVILKLYSVNIKPSEKDVSKILAAFNKTMHTKITTSDISSKAVLKQVRFDAKVATDLMVAGTPTIYLDGKVDKAKNQYKKVK